MTDVTAGRQVELRVEQGVATIELARPDQLNAFTDVMEQQIIDCLDRCDQDDAVRAIVLTGQGRAFCAGMDLSGAADSFDLWRESPDAPEGTQFRWPGDPMMMRRDGGGRVVLRMFASRKPIIAAINGHAVGVGATMVLAADVRLTVPGAKFGFVFARRGIVPESCSSWFLPRVVSMPTALEWMTSGRVFRAEEALAAGLVSAVHAPDDLLTAADALAHQMTDDTSAMSVAFVRRLLWDMSSAPHPLAAHHAETLALNRRGISADAQEGIEAFLRKRSPAFSDRVSDHLDELVPWMSRGVSPIPDGAQPLQETP
ncbi:enoyl-CoA hydratase/isomerase family protein [Aeromicrobium sp. CFBP 8757]|uniref:enoyl-CoA hydratase-related protein n=1 Tax=Aeromicrobium sp. CFBP 8757 TaxID=2775288 RepID=UPI00177E01DB|nr:enoyl-CoA hydratase-related protein [Aeromicrobium sp. CFBP 8757]MBD8605454.1 enoyl-CoA hydratase/isomerase family protein [Aeromicrobium sp. CFBP 8757]